MTHNKWSKRKPKFTEGCLMITASYFRGSNKWEYSVWTVEKTIYDDGDVVRWYWALYCGDGNEWGDIADLAADKYYTMPLLKTPKP